MEFWKSDAPGSRYQWGAGIFDRSAMIVRDQAKILQQNDRGEIEVYQFSRNANGGAFGKPSGVPFRELPSMACQPGESLPSMLKRAIFQGRFMLAASQVIQAKRAGRTVKNELIDPATGKLTMVGRFWAVISEANSLTPAVRKGLSKIASMRLEGKFSDLKDIDKTSLETLEVIPEFYLEDDEEIDSSYAAWFEALGFLPEGKPANKSYKRTREFMQAVADYWASQPSAEARAIESYGLAKCVIDSMEGENMGLWKYSEPVVPE